jgi:hypothetical protein
MRHGTSEAEGVSGGVVLVGHPLAVLRARGVLIGDTPVAGSAGAR